MNPLPATSGTAATTTTPPAAALKTAKTIGAAAAAPADAKSPPATAAPTHLLAALAKLGDAHSASSKPKAKVSGNQATESERKKMRDVGNFFHQQAFKNDSNSSRARDIKAAAEASALLIDAENNENAVEEEEPQDKKKWITDQTLSVLVAKFQLDKKLEGFKKLETRSHTVEATLASSNITKLKWNASYHQLPVEEAVQLHLLQLLQYLENQEAIDFKGKGLFLLLINRLQSNPFDKRNQQIIKKLVAVLPQFIQDRAIYEKVKGDLQALSLFCSSTLFHEKKVVDCLPTAAPSAQTIEKALLMADLSLLMHSTLHTLDQALTYVSHGKVLSQFLESLESAHLDRKIFFDLLKKIEVLNKIYQSRKKHLLKQMAFLVRQINSQKIPQEQIRYCLNRIRVNHELLKKHIVNLGVCIQNLIFQICNLIPFQEQVSMSQSKGFNNIVLDSDPMTLEEYNRNCDVCRIEKIELFLMLSQLAKTPQQANIALIRQKMHKFLASLRKIFMNSELPKTVCIEAFSGLDEGIFAKFIDLSRKVDTTHEGGLFDLTYELDQLEDVVIKRKEKTLFRDASRLQEQIQNQEKHAEAQEALVKEKTITAKQARNLKTSLHESYLKFWFGLQLCGFALKGVESCNIFVNTFHSRLLPPPPPPTAATIVVAQSQEDLEALGAEYRDIEDRASLLLEENEKQEIDAKNKHAAAQYVEDEFTLPFQSTDKTASAGLVGSSGSTGSAAPSVASPTKVVVVASPLTPTVPQPTFMEMLEPLCSSVMHMPAPKRLSRLVLEDVAYHLGVLGSTVDLLKTCLQNKEANPFYPRLMARLVRNSAILSEQAIASELVGKGVKLSELSHSHLKSAEQASFLANYPEPEQKLLSPFLGLVNFGTVAHRFPHSTQRMWQQRGLDNPMTLQWMLRPELATAKAMIELAVQSVQFIEIWTKQPSSMISQRLLKELGALREITAASPKSPVSEELSKNLAKTFTTLDLLIQKAKQKGEACLKLASTPKVQSQLINLIDISYLLQGLQDSLKCWIASPESRVLLSHVDDVMLLLVTLDESIGEHLHLEMYGERLENHDILGAREVVGEEVTDADKEVIDDLNIGSGGQYVNRERYFLQNPNHMEKAVLFTKLPKAITLRLQAFIASRNGDGYDAGWTPAAVKGQKVLQMTPEQLRQDLVHLVKAVVAMAQKRFT